jgi:hypothetical protein
MEPGLLRCLIKSVTGLREAVLSSRVVCRQTHGSRRRLLPHQFGPTIDKLPSKVSLSELSGVDPSTIFGMSGFTQRVAQTCRQSASQRNTILQRRKPRRRNAVTPLQNRTFPQRHEKALRRQSGSRSFFRVPDNTLGIGQPDPRRARLLGQ